MLKHNAACSAHFEHWERWALGTGRPVSFITSAQIPGVASGKKWFHQYDNGCTLLDAGD